MANNLKQPQSQPVGVPRKVGPLTDVEMNVGKTVDTFARTFHLRFWFIGFRAALLLHDGEDARAIASKLRRLADDLDGGLVPGATTTPAIPSQSTPQGRAP